MLKYSTLHVIHVSNDFIKNPPVIKDDNGTCMKLPIGSMYGIYANIWGILMVNVTIYGIHTDPMGYDKMFSFRR